MNRNLVYKYFKKISRHCVLLVFSIIALYPFTWALITSLKPRAELFRFSLLFKPTLIHYMDVFSRYSFWLYFGNSVIISLSSTILSLLLGLPAAYALARSEQKRSGIAFYFLSTRMAPPIAFLIPYFLMYIKLGLFDTHVGMIILYTLFNLALVIWLMRGFFLDVPLEIEGSALIDGCSRWQAFVRITLPLTSYGIAATGVLCFLFTWNEFLAAIILTGRNAKTLPSFIYMFLSTFQLDWGGLCASTVITCIPVLAFGILFRKFLVRGLTMGAVKG